tara:strand:+ start:29328 stop:30239 length:912 start_codon:yes stop_codon:yes gene_type:complete
VKWIKNSEIARLSGLTITQVIRQLTRLQKLGYIRVRIKEAPKNRCLASYGGAILLNASHPDFKKIEDTDRAKLIILPKFDGALGSLLDTMDKVETIARLESELAAPPSNLRSKPMAKGKHEAIAFDLQVLKREFARGANWFALPSKTMTIDSNEGSVKPLALPVVRDNTPSPTPNLHEMFSGNKPIIRSLVTFIVCECAAEILNRDGQHLSKTPSVLNERLPHYIYAMISNGREEASDTNQAIAIWFYGWALALAKELSSIEGRPLTGNGTTESGGGQVLLFPMVARALLFVGFKRERYGEHQ